MREPLACFSGFSKTLACRGLRVGPSKLETPNGYQIAGAPKLRVLYLPLWKPSALMLFWVLRNHPNGYQNCRCTKICEFWQSPELAILKPIGFDALLCVVDRYSRGIPEAPQPLNIQTVRLLETPLQITPQTLWKCKIPTSLVKVHWWSCFLSPDTIMQFLRLPATHPSKTALSCRKVRVSVGKRNFCGEVQEHAFCFQQKPYFCNLLGV